MNIREEQDSDIDGIWQVNAEAFESRSEADLVNELRNSGCTFISLVAETDNKVVGHILFTPVELAGDKNPVKIMGLAPMAVLSDYQSKGIGAQLVKSGLDLCRSLGYDAIVVLGHPGYYPKFGFKPSAGYGIRSEYDVPEDVFMVLELSQGSLKGHRGAIKYHDAFKNA